MRLEGLIVRTLTGPVFLFAATPASHPTQPPMVHRGKIGGWVGRRGGWLARAKAQRTTGAKPVRRD